MPLIAEKSLQWGADVDTTNGAKVGSIDDPSRAGVDQILCDGLGYRLVGVPLESTPIIYVV